MKQKALLTFVASLLCVSFFGGCCSVSVAHDGPNMVTVQNSGLFLFSLMPIFSGDPKYPNEEVCTWFDDTVNLQTNIRLLEEEAFAQHAHGYRNLVSHPDEEKVLWFFLKRKIYRTSAELVP